MQLLANLGKEVDLSHFHWNCLYNYVEYILNFNCNRRKYTLLKATLQMATDIFWYRYVVLVHAFPLKKKKTKKRRNPIICIMCKVKGDTNFLLLHEI